MDSRTVVNALMRKTGRSLALVCFVATLAACGGGGGGGGGDSAASSAAPGASSGGSSAPSTSTPSTPSSRAQNVNLSWTPPSARADGTALSLSELSGYKVYIVAESDPSKDRTQTVSGGSTTTAQLSLAAPGTYTLAITSLDQNGLESALSNTVTVTLN